MAFVDLKCPNCGGAIKVSPDNKTGICVNCGGQLLLETEVTEKINRAFDLITQLYHLKAKKLLEEVLNIDAKNGEAYLGLLLCELELKSPAELSEARCDYSSNQNYIRALQFLTGLKKTQLLQLCSQNIQYQVTKKNAAKNTSYIPSPLIEEFNKINVVESPKGNIPLTMFYAVLDFNQYKFEEILAIYEKTKNSMKRIMEILKTLTAEDRKKIPGFDQTTAVNGINAFLKIEHTILTKLQESEKNQLPDEDDCDDYDEDDCDDYDANNCDNCGENNYNNLIINCGHGANFGVIRGSNNISCHMNGSNNISCHINGMYMEARDNKIYVDGVLKYELPVRVGSFSIRKGNLTICDSNGKVIMDTGININNINVNNNSSKDNKTIEKPAKQFIKPEEITRIKEIDKEISDLEYEKGGLGIFNGKRKKEIKERLDSLNKEKKTININQEIRKIESSIDGIKQKIKELDDKYLPVISEAEEELSKTAFTAFKRRAELKTVIKENKYEHSEGLKEYKSDLNSKNVELQEQKKKLSKLS